MRYDILEFNKSVAYFKNKLKGNKNLLIYGNFNRKAYLSMAPLSRAAHELGINIYVSFNSKKKIKRLIKIYEDYNIKEKVLVDFVKYVDIKTKGKFKKIFKKPTIIIVGRDRFRGALEMDYRSGWFKFYKKQKLLETSILILKEVYNLKKSEKLGLGFELIPKKKDTLMPLVDYLDSYLIVLSKYMVAECKQVTVSASTAKMSQLDFPEPVSELLATLQGCEMDKNIPEKVFQIFKKVSKKYALASVFDFNDAVFSIKGRGYHGKHMFGEQIGYPTPDLKTRWNSPGGMVYKFPWYPQTIHESRPPRTRIAFTETVPIDTYIKSTNIDYKLMRARNKKIQIELAKCEYVMVESKKYSNFKVGLRINKNKKRKVMRSDSDVRTKVDKTYLKETGIQAGRMANIPGGEAFLTPEWVEGTIMGDVVINIDQSYSLSGKNPLIIESGKRGYKIIKGPKRIIEKLKTRKKEAWKKIMLQEKNKSIPRSIIKTKKDNFGHIGEFAVNTNPHAELCNYLIINEKIANMIHVALGSGFEADKATEYHMDIVIDSPRQKLNIYGVDKKAKKHWILEEGKFVI